jgi:hypothetical protein
MIGAAAAMTAPLIKEYHFGSINIDGEVFREDVIIFSDHVQSRWWRQQGHSLALDDLDSVLAQAPDILIVGCGAQGRMQVPDSTRRQLDEQGIQVQAHRTAEAVEQYNRIREERDVVAALHLTC